ncbi:post-GPI attachment to proteins factor 3-like [Triticum dicoccoides]|uniref:post-GPI attachment to proteins factor 3-like n=1 Tax=Triticum dicoccoides TaxID=85692 RepID=UPI000E78E6D4|nr:post-GPI attachment to proteins factor 3-like [Triticum dicoccoides]XP_037427132.1 post-GPI attachment to proteins factor 3-like [Triticum dicoccoides]
MARSSLLCLVRLASLLALAGIFVSVSVQASRGDADPHYRTCVGECQNTGIIGSNIISHCQSRENDSISAGSSWYTQEALGMQWKQLNCMTDCRYYCMMRREEERRLGGLSPVQYHGKWPFKRVSVFQEPLSAALSALNLLMHFTGWLSFYLLVKCRLPLRPQTKRTYYEYTGLWHIYAILSMNAWIWSSVFHTRDIDLTEKLDYSSAVAVLGYSLIVTLLRIFNVKEGPARVMVAAPILAFVTTHILYLNFYELDYGWNMKVCVAMGVIQIVAWATWAGVTRHPSRLKLWVVVFGGALAMLLEVFDFPPYKRYADAHSLWHASTVPLTYLWWSFIKDDAEFRTSTLTLVKKAR